jgi:hypothetical protein
VTTPAHEAPKEVAQMISNKTQMAAQIPSGFGAPTCGHAFGITAVLASPRTLGTSVVRDRKDVGTKGDMGITTAYFPGTSAWRPPNC